MIEVVPRVVRHADALHDAARRLVGGDRKRHDLIELGHLETEAHRLGGGFGGVATTPVIGPEPPPDLHGRREVRLEGRRPQPDESDEWLAIANLDCPQPEPSLLEALLDPVDEGIGLRGGEGTLEMLHHPRIGIHLGECLAVVGSPTPHEQPFGHQLRGTAHPRIVGGPCRCRMPASGNYPYPTICATEERAEPVAFRSIPQKVFDNGVQRASSPAYYERINDEWVPTSWSAYADQVRSAAKSLIALGVGSGDAVNILGSNTPEWVIMDVAAMVVGGVPAGIYATNSPVECQYILNHSEAPVVLLENEEQWKKIAAVRQDLPHLRHAVMMRGAAAIDDPLAMSWDEFTAKGADVSDDTVQERLDALEPDQLATLIYTSGTTGPPKGVMLSHDNLAWTASEGIGAFGMDESEVGLSYLPLSHIAEQMFTIHIPTTIGSAVAYAESLEKLPDNIKEIRPTYFAGVPRVWEKFYAGVQAELAKAEGAKAGIAKWAMGVGRKANAARMKGQTPNPLIVAQEKVADTLVLSKVRAALGFDRAHVYLTAAAPISPEIQEFFSAFFVLNEVYGQSEDTGPTSMTVPGKTKFGTVGIPYPGTQVRIADDGEILVKGRNVFLGYYKQPEATAETLVDGWLHSGDLGEFDNEGYLHITGRKKDIIITAGGKNIAPKPLESGMKNHPLVGEAVVIGDRKKFLSALISLDEEAVPAWLEEHGEEGPAHESESIQKELQGAINELNKNFARVEQIRQFRVLPRQLSIEGGELTPTLKVKRNKVAEHFADVIDDIYSD